MISSLIGVWKLYQWSVTNPVSYKQHFPFGTNPYGFVTFTKEGLFHNTVVQEENTFDEEFSSQFQSQILYFNTSLIAESGTYKKLSEHKVQIEITPSEFSALRQRRIWNFQIDESVLTVASSQNQNSEPIDQFEIVIWEKTNYSMPSILS